MSVWGYSKEFDGSRLVSSLRSRKKGLLTGVAWYWIILAVVVTLDLLSKWLVTQNMVLHQSVSLLGTFLSLTYVRNTGAAFSLLANFDSPWRLVLFVTVPIIAILLLTTLAYRERQRSFLALCPLGLISGGALGNLLDRVFSGTVVDFIDVSYRSWHWPVFNLADLAVVIGVGWLLLTSFRNRSRRWKR